MPTACCAARKSRPAAALLAPRFTTRSNSDSTLFTLCERAGKLYRKSTLDALACGKLLLQARAVAEHGKWLTSLAEAGISPRSAQDLMRVAEYAGDDEAKCAAVAHLGIRQTLEFLRAVERARAAWWAAAKADPDNHSLVQLAPDGPFAALAWCTTPRDIEAIVHYAAYHFELSYEDMAAVLCEAVQE